MDFESLADLVGGAIEQRLPFASTTWARPGPALLHGINAAGPPLLFGLRLWASVSLALYVAFYLQLDNAFWAGTSAALMCQPRLGASLRKGWFRMLGTVVGAVAIVVLTALFPQDRALFLLGLALWGAACTFCATLLRNFAAYAAALAGYTAAIIASDQLGAVGGLNGDAFMLAVIRVSEICIGIVCAGIVLAGTDFGSARHRLAERLAALIAEIADRFAATLVRGRTDFSQTQPIRRELTRRVIALDSILDEVIGESPQLRHHSSVLQRAMDGLFASLASWRAAAAQLARSSDSAARRDADLVLGHVPQAILSLPDERNGERWLIDPDGLHRLCDQAVRALIALPAATPSLRLVADETAKALAGISCALQGMALLLRTRARGFHRDREVELYVPDWLPAFINAARSFVAISTVAVFWIVTAWPNGASAIIFAAISLLRFAPRADQAYTGAISFMTGTAFAAIFAAIIAFALLPRVETFEGFSLVLALFLVPAGALMAQSWQPGMFATMAGIFMPILAPANQMSYDTANFYNAAAAIVFGCGAAAMSFRLLPPLAPAPRTRRLLSLSLRDLRRIATAPVLPSAQEWQGRSFSRLSAMPEEAEPLQRAQLMVALSMGTDIIRLRDVAGQLALERKLDPALLALAEGKSAIAIARLRQLDEQLASDKDMVAEQAVLVRARALILAIADMLTEHAAYFGGGALA